MSRILVFFHASTCGHSRRMDSIVDHFLRLHRVNVDSAPTLLMLQDLQEVARIEGRRTLPDMKDAFEPFLGLEPTELPVELAGAC